MLVMARTPSSRLALPEQAQQQLEQVDEVEIERQRAHHGQLVGPLGPGIGQILAFQALGVPGGEACEYQHASDREDELQRRGADEQVEDRKSTPLHYSQ